MADDLDLPDEVRRAAALYVKRGESVGGPFARGLLERHLELGRLAGTDLLGVDRTHWWPADSILALEDPLLAEAGVSPGAEADLDWTEERRRARRRWIDERSGTDRRALSESAAPKEARSGKDRRAPDSGPELPPRFGAPDDAGATGTRRSLVIVTAVIVLLVGIGVYAWFFAPRFAPRIHLLP